MLNNYQKYNLPKLGYIKLPSMEITRQDRERLGIKGNSNVEYLRALARDGFENKIKSGHIPVKLSDLYWDRIVFELSEIEKLLFTDYILLVYSIIKFCDNNGILNGYGRGSCAGSLLLYCLGVTKVDPIKYKLLFERFISSGRTEFKEIDGVKYIKSENLPDVDIDSDRELKYKINEFIETQFPRRTAQIKTLGTLQGKSAIKEVLKIYEEYSEEQAKEISDIIETRFGKVEQISDALSNDPKKENKKFKEWATLHEESVRISSQINGLIKNSSVHASGIILCEEEINKSIPLELSSDSNDRTPVTAYDMIGAQMFGVKIDNLGLKNLTSIKECLSLINKKMEDIDVNDKSIYNFLKKSSDYRGIFQAEEGLGKSVMKKLQCNDIEDITMSIAIGRPGSMKFLDEIVEARKDNINIRDIDKRIKDILSPTYNVIVYQEQIMALSRTMAGFTAQQSDGLRKGIGKKIVDKILEYEPKFKEGALKNNYSQDLIDGLWRTFVDSGDYLFNKSHASGYGHLSAICAYLKANHPIEFFYSLLKNAKNETKPQEEIAAISEELPRFGIKLVGPDLIKSSDDFVIENKNTIRMGLGNIKGVSDKALAKLKNFCHAHSNKFEIFKAANECGINIAVLANLILAGAMDDYITQTRTLTVREMQTWNLLTEREQKMFLAIGKDFEFDVIKIIQYLKVPQNGTTKPFISAKRLQTIRRDYNKYHEMYKQNSKNEDLCSYIMEKSLLGFSYSQDLVEILNRENSGYEVITIQEAMGRDMKENVVIAGEITEVRSGTSKNKNKYVKCMISDGTGSIYIMLMQKNFEENDEINNGAKYESGQIVLANGQKGSDIVFCDKIIIQNIKIITKAKDEKEEKKS